MKNVFFDFIFSSFSQLHLLADSTGECQVRKRLFVYECVCFVNECVFVLECNPHRDQHCLHQWFNCIFFSLISMSHVFWWYFGLDVVFLAMLINVKTVPVLSAFAKLHFACIGVCLTDSDLPFSRSVVPV